MKFICSQQILSKALNTVSKAVTVRTTIPILKGICIKALEDGNVSLTASDLDLSIETVIEDVDVLEVGETVVFSKLFIDIIRKLPNEPLTIELNEKGQVKIKSLSSEFNIVGLSPEDFPAIGEIKENDENLSFDKDLFKEMIKKTYFSASIDEAKGIIVGVLLEIEKNSFNMVALDGFRMAVVRENMENKEKRNIIISAKILNEINKILSENDKVEDIKLIINENKGIILIKNTKIVMRLMDGEFIKYKEILPKAGKTKICTEKNILLEAIERASLLAREGKNNLIRCNIKENLLTINSSSEEGDVKEEIIVNKEGEDIEIGFNSKYIIEALKAITEEDIVIELNTNVSPCIIKPPVGESFEYLILPVRIPTN